MHISSGLLLPQRKIRILHNLKRMNTCLKTCFIYSHITMETFKVFPLNIILQNSIICGWICMRFRLSINALLSSFFFFSFFIWRCSENFLFYSSKVYYFCWKTETYYENQHKRVTLCERIISHIVQVSLYLWVSVKLKFSNCSAVHIISDLC